MLSNEVVGETTAAMQPFFFVRLWAWKIGCDGTTTWNRHMAPPPPFTPRSCPIHRSGWCGWTTTPRWCTMDSNKCFLTRCPWHLHAVDGLARSGMARQTGMGTSRRRGQTSKRRLSRASTLNYLVMFTNCLSKNYRTFMACFEPVCHKWQDNCDPFRIQETIFLSQCASLEVWYHQANRFYRLSFTHNCGKFSARFIYFRKNLNVFFFCDVCWDTTRSDCVVEENIVCACKFEQELSLRVVF